MEVPVDLLHHRLQAGEARGESGVVGEEVLHAERGERRGVAVVLEPALRDLGHPPARAGFDGRAAGRAAGGDDLGDGRVDERSHQCRQGEHERSAWHLNLTVGRPS
jgi:hypothetical protein